MAHRKSLKFALTVALLLVCGASRQAAAQLGTGGSTGLLGSGGTTGSSTFSSSDFFVGIQQVQGVNLTTFDVARFFNQARCECETPVYIFISLLPSGIAKRATITSTTGTVSVILGSQCGTVAGQAIADCVPVKNGTEPVLTFFNNASMTIQTDAKTLSAYLAPNTGTIVDAGTTTTPGSDGCTSPNGGQFTQVINVNFDFDGDGYVDLSVPNSVTIDLAPPPAPTGVTTRGGNEAVIMNWQQVNQALTTDLLGYQILCSRADQYQVFPGADTDAGGSNGAFSSAFMTCPKTRPDGGIEVLNPSFVCSPLLSAVSTSYRVETLQNNITYATTVVAIDNSGNASQPAVSYGTPVPTLSFYDVYRNGYAANTQSSGGQADPGGAAGGFCAVAVRRPGWRSAAGALAAFALGGVGLAIARRRRRGRR